jgi:hypothetical protein
MIEKIQCLAIIATIYNNIGDFNILPILPE